MTGHQGDPSSHASRRRLFLFFFLSFKTTIAFNFDFTLDFNCSSVCIVLPAVHSKRSAAASIDTALAFHHATVQLCQHSMTCLVVPASIRPQGVGSKTYSTHILVNYRISAYFRHHLRCVDYILMPIRRGLYCNGVLLERWCVPLRHLTIRKSTVHSLVLDRPEAISVISYDGWTLAKQTTPVLLCR